MRPYAVFERLSPADQAWLTLAIGILVWDIAGPEMLSEASARYTAAHPVLSRLIITYLAGHLMHAWPARWDLLTRLAG